MAAKHTSPIAIAARSNISEVLLLSERALEGAAGF